MAVMAVADTATFDLSRNAGGGTGGTRCASRPGTSTRSRPGWRRSSGGWTRARPDVLLIQETKLADQDAPLHAVLDGRLRASSITARAAGTASRSLTRQGLGVERTRSRTSATARVRDSRAPGRRRRSARTTSTRSTRRACCSAVCERASGSSASTRRTGASSARRSTRASCNWYARLAAAGCASRRSPDDDLVIGGDFNVAPTDDDVWDAEAGPRRDARVGSPSGPPSQQLLDWGLVDAYRSRPLRDRALHVVGLPRRQLPQELRDADRPPPRDAARGRADRLPPRSTARRARASRSRPTTRRCVLDLDERGRAVRRGLGGSGRADRGPRRRQAEVATAR